MREALGLVEVAGKLGAIVIADVMAKVANVNIIGMEKAKGFGWMTVKVTGDVGAVQAAVEAAVATAKSMQLLVATKVIPRVSEDVVAVFLTPPVKEAETHPEEIVDVVEEVVEAVVEEEVPEVEPVVVQEVAPVELPAEAKEVIPVTTTAKTNSKRARRTKKTSN